MCGIVGVAGSQTAYGDVLDGLKRLEYRGYDSAGVAGVDESGIDVRREKGKIAALEELLIKHPLRAKPKAAIGHTRWATHGEPSQTNAHPHATPLCAVVHNGIIENYQTLRAELSAVGVKFLSQTDTETIPALITEYLKKGLAPYAAVKAAVERAEGAFALAIVFKDYPDLIIATRRGAPLCVGLGLGSQVGRNYVASDPLALAPFTNTFMFLEDDDIAIVTSKTLEVRGSDGAVVQRPLKSLDVSSVLAGKAGYKHFMLKEIHEQPAVVARLLEAYVAPDGHIKLPNLPCDVSKVPQISLVACGTAYYAGLTGKYLFEQIAHIPTQVDVASEFRYRNPPLVKGGLFIAISQSGETADTLAALEYAKKAGQHVLAITNTPTSSIARAADGVLELLAGPEIAVASTKAFTAMLVVLTLVALHAAHRSGEDVETAVQALRELPSKLTGLLDAAQQVEKVAETLVNSTSMIYLGRGLLYPLACEGALKMKEISYIHAESYASGEMKHGPIALVDKTLPVINLAASNDGLFEKTVSNMKEIQARHGRIILITDAVGVKKAGHEAEQVLTIPHATHPCVLPLLALIPLQLLAYHVAVAKGTDVDQPRNLAKSVTVE